MTGPRYNRCPHCGVQFLSRHSCDHHLRPSRSTSGSSGEIVFALGIFVAVVAFVVYCGYRYLFSDPSEPFFAGRIGEVMGGIGGLLLFFGAMIFCIVLGDKIDPFLKARGIWSSRELNGGVIFWGGLGLVVLSTYIAGLVMPPSTLDETPTNVTPEKVPRVNGVPVEYHTFVDSSGTKKVRVRIIKVDDTRVQLEKEDGEQVWVQIEKLGQAEQSIVNRWKSERR